MIGREVVGFLWIPRGTRPPRPPAGSRLVEVDPDQVADFALAKRRRAAGKFYLAERDPAAEQGRAVLWCGVALAVLVLAVAAFS